MSSNNVCYVCGHYGPTEITHTRTNNTTGQSTSAKIPSFPSLLLVSPAPSSKPPAPSDGHVRLCVLCIRLLLEQWKSYEKRKVPLSNRQYWFKCCSANREPFDSVAGTRLSTEGQSANDGDGLDRSESISPNAGSENQRRKSVSTGVSVSATVENATAQESCRVDATGKLKGTTTDPKCTGTDKLICVVCSRSIESMDVCRQLPAHLVAHVTDLKPNLGQPVDRDRTSIPNLTGEALVCDECFASPSFQSAWLDCCRRGGVPSNLAPSQQESVPSRSERAVSTEQLSLGSLLRHAPEMANIQQQSNLTEAQRQWFALYERALLQFHFTGQLDPMVLGQLQQLAAAEALASLQHCGTSGETTDSA